MNVSILAHTVLLSDVLRAEYGYDAWSSAHNNPWPEDADALAEAAGRICYLSFDRPSPATASNSGYLANILRQGHYSVLEHSSVTFLVRGVSRSLLAELSRHRHLSFSVVSQRYVDYSKTQPVIPPALRGSEGEALLRSAYNYAIGRYEALTKELRAKGLSRKQAREAARSVLPNAAPVDMVVTGNLRAWRDVLAKRWHVAADAEIQEFAAHVYDHLCDIAPNSVQDLAEKGGK